jgi:Raf kinase inhibitor-like YbhB/YbcL family protein
MVEAPAEDGEAPTVLTRFLLAPLAALLLLTGACTSDDSDDTTTTTADAQQGTGDEGMDDGDDQGSEVTETPEMFISSTSFPTGEAIPAEFTCDGANTQPAVMWEGVPEGTEEMVLIVDDPDAPGGSFIHWVIWGLDPNGSIEQGSVPEGAIQGSNGLENQEWFGPCPPPGQPHDYEFQVHAVSETPDVEPGATADELRQAIADTTLSSATLVGTYERF